MIKTIREDYYSFTKKIKYKEFMNLEIGDIKRFYLIRFILIRKVLPGCKVTWAHLGQWEDAHTVTMKK